MFGNIQRWLRERNQKNKVDLNNIPNGPFGYLGPTERRLNYDKRTNLDKAEEIAAEKKRKQTQKWISVYENPSHDDYYDDNDDRVSDRRWNLDLK
jgi:hypothetical protein